VKALLDEQLSPRIAELLHDRGHDVQAVGERDDLAGKADWVVLETAVVEERVVITNNVKDFRPPVAERLARGESHAGLILVPSKRSRRRAAVEELAAAIERIFDEHPDGLESTERWIPPLSTR
jgi:hypothetical protein